MAKLTLNDVSSGFASNTAHNTNNTLIENALENTLSRDGTGPNQMEANLDMNSFKVVNLAEPINDNEAARLVDVQNALAGAKTANLTTFTPYSNLSSNNVQAAIQEEVDDLAAPTGSTLVGDTTGGGLWSTVKGFITYLLSSAGSSLIGFIQAGVGAIARTLESKARDTVSVFDFMTAAQIADVRAHTGSINVAANIKAAYEAIYNNKQGGTLLLPTGTYNIGNTTLVFDKPNIRVVGEGIPTRGAYDSRGTNIKYSGSGTGIQLGKTFISTDPEPFIFGLGLENIHLIVATTTAIGIDVLSAAYGDMSYVTVYGNSVSGRVGIRARGLIGFKFFQVDVQGNGGAAPGDYANFATGFYLTKSIYTDTLGLAIASTAVTFERCYFHYCSNAFVTDTTGTCTMEACDFESAIYGAVINEQSGVSFNRCHFENNQTAEVYFGLSTSSVANDVSFNKCEFDAYARAMYFTGNATSGPPYHIRLHDCIFNGSNANQYLFDSAFLTAIAANSDIKLSGNHFFNANSAVKDGVRTSNSSVAQEAAFVKFTDMQTEVFTFSRGSVAAATAYPSILLRGVASNIPMREGGHVLGVNTYYSSTITAGSYTGSTKINTVALADLSTPTIPAISTNLIVHSSPLRNTVAAGDILSVDLTTDASFAPTGGSLTWEVIVAYGKDGTEHH